MKKVLTKVYEFLDVNNKLIDTILGLTLLWFIILFIMAIANSIT